MARRYSCPFIGPPCLFGTEAASALTPELEDFGRLSERGRCARPCRCRWRADAACPRCCASRASRSRAAVWRGWAICGCACRGSRSPAIGAPGARRQHRPARPRRAARDPARGVLRASRRVRLGQPARDRRAGRARGRRAQRARDRAQRRRHAGRSRHDRVGRRASRGGRLPQLGADRRRAARLPGRRARDARLTAAAQRLQPGRRDRPDRAADRRARAVPVTRQNAASSLASPTGSS